MRVTAVLGAQAIRFVNAPDLPEEEKVPLYPLLKAVQERYNFLQVPNKIEDFDFTKGVTFLMGLFEKKVIEKFQIYNRGILCESKTDTAHCERFVEDVLDFGLKMGLPFLKLDGFDRAYFSSLEVHMDGSLGDHVAKLSTLSSLMMEKFKSYGLATTAFPTFGFKLNADATKETIPVPNEFVFERRAGQPFTSSLYASWGSLKTEDHIEVLHAIEAMMKA